MRGSGGTATSIQSSRSALGVGQDIRFVLVEFKFGGEFLFFFPSLSLFSSCRPY